MTMFSFRKIKGTRETVVALRSVMEKRLEKNQDTFTIVQGGQNSEKTEVSCTESWWYTICTGTKREQ